MSARNAGTSPATSSADRELVFTRVFDAPRELVFDAFTNPEHLAKWWGPQGFTTTVHEMDVRPGGIWRLTMHGHDGRDYHNRIVMLEVVKPDRLVFRHEPDHDSERVTHQTTVTFNSHRGKTLLTMRLLFDSPATRAHVIKTYGAIEGGHQTLSRLIGHLQSATGKPSSVAAPLFISRLLNASRNLVFEMWSKPEHLARWWGPNGFTLPRCKMDFRTAGAFQLVMRAPDGADFPLRGEYLEIIEPERIAFHEFHSQHGHEVFTIITLLEEDGKTRLIVQQAYLFESDATQGAPEGWQQTLNRLESALATSL